MSPTIVANSVRNISMPSFEEICQKVSTGEHFNARFLIGGLVSFLPVVNIFALGYLYRYSEKVRRSGKLILPPWDPHEWKGLFVDGLRFLAVILLFFGIPVFLGGMLTALLARSLDIVPNPAMALFGFIFGFLMAVAYLPLAAALFFGPILTIAALCNYQSRERFEDLARLDLVFRLVRKAGRRIIIPSLSFTGVIVVGAPVAGFAFFLGFTMIIAYYTIVFAVLEKEGSL